jgi:hypothetical protein
MYKRKIYNTVLKRVLEDRKFIQVLLGPRQVGKTTLSMQIKDEIKTSSIFISADIATLKDLSWLEKNWQSAREKAKNAKECLLIIDEVQKIPNWSSMIKKLWDEDTRNKINLKVIILGSSPWLMQKGLTESLAGRFEIIHVTHWNFLEMSEYFKFDLNEFIFYGGYPGAASFAKEKDFERWLNYINDSLIETTVSRDILLMTRVDKPVLLRRLFQFACTYSSQILSYQKMLGQLQDAGNTTTLAHYLELLTGTNLATGLSKFSSKEIKVRSSSPKLQVFNTALMSACVNKTFDEAKNDGEYWGRLVESAIGAHLLNEIKGKQIQLFYWRENNLEVDFVLKKGNYITAIEVKSSYKKVNLSAIDAFKKAFNPNKILAVGNSGLSIEEFLKTPILEFMKD